MSAVAAAIGGVAAIGGALISSSAVGSAANKQAAASQASLAEQGREFDINQANYAPWLGAGKSALAQQLGLLGLGGSQPGQTDWGAYVNGNPDALANWNAIKDTSAGQQFNGDIGAFGQYHYAADGSRRDLTPYSGTAGNVQQNAINQLQQSPLYQSLYRNGQDTILNNAAATGGLRGGNLQHSLANFGADTLAQVIQQQLSNLGGISNTGNQSAGSLGQLNGQTANSISSINAQQGSAQAGGILGQAGVWNNAFNQIGSLGGKIANGLGGNSGIDMNSFNQLVGSNNANLANQYGF